MQETPTAGDGGLMMDLKQLVDLKQLQSRVRRVDIGLAASLRKTGEDQPRWIRTVV